MTVEDEFDRNEIEAALKQHENATPSDEMFDECENPDFRDDDTLPADLANYDMASPKVIGEKDITEDIAASAIAF